MKYYFSIILVLSITNLAFTQNINYTKNTFSWSQDELVSNYPNEDSRYARITIDHENTIHLVYSDDVPDLYPYGQKIIYKKKTQDGTWTDDLIICEFDGTTVNNQYPDISVAPNGNVHIVFRHTVLGEPEYIGHSYYDASLDQWTQENISSNNTVDLFPYPVVSTTYDSRPIAAWSDDFALNSTSEAYFAYHDGSNWSDVILLGRDDDKKSHSVKITSLENQTSIICFAEVSEDGSNEEMFYFIFDENTNTLSQQKSIPTTEIPQNTYLFNYEIIKSTTEEIALLAYNKGDTIFALIYDIVNDNFIETNNLIETDGGAYTLQKLLDITCDMYGKFHIPFSQNNSNGLFYTKYQIDSGFTSIETINTYSNIDNPSIVCDDSNMLHLIYCDSRDDTNGDQYIDREVYYSVLDLGTGIINTENVKPNGLFYPNPAHSEVYIDVPDVKNIEIYNMSGKLMTSSNNINIDISYFKKGVYIVKIITSKNIYSEKLLIN
jgi:hypothetical protein